MWQLTPAQRLVYFNLGLKGSLRAFGIIIGILQNRLRSQHERGISKPLRRCDFNAVYSPYVENTAITFEMRSMTIEDLQLGLGKHWKNIAYLVAEEDSLILELCPMLQLIMRVQPI